MFASFNDVIYFHLYSCVPPRLVHRISCFMYCRYFRKQYELNHARDNEAACLSFGVGNNIFQEKCKFESSVWVWSHCFTTVCILYITSTSIGIKTGGMILMAYCKTVVTPLLKQWSYCSLALSHQYIDRGYNRYLYHTTALMHIAIHVPCNYTLYIFLHYTFPLSKYIAKGLLVCMRVLVPRGLV